ncbi:DUF6049 family protein [Bifidobacterium callitrichos]|uniref:DUF6049 family protein n=1 Tax=Bifidobacterium callitrichos TaxID=762209 RepID=UPI0015E62C42|nr:DUF6049 family protein [Bifidobacterium callitrichos]
MNHDTLYALRTLHARWGRVLGGLLLVVAVLAGMIGVAGVAGPTAVAQAAGTTADGTADTDGTSGSTTSAAQQRHTIALVSATAVVTATSGYHLTATITNTGDGTWAAGSLTLSVNPMYTFVSRTDMQEWAQAENRIPTPSLLGSVDVPAIDPGKSVTMTVDVPADADALKRITNWGPKPLLVDYMPGDGSAEDGAQLRTFLTRSSSGLGNATPAMKLTVTMPLTSSHWTTNDEKLNGLVTGDTTVDDATVSANSNGGNDASATSNANGTSSDAVTLEQDHTRFDRMLAQVLTKHSGLETVADPTYLDALATPPQVSAVMQPADFDITTYAARADDQAYAAAGVSTKAWNASAAIAHYRAAVNDPQASTGTIAWQGKAKWTLQALTAARQQGYGTVIATHDFESADASTVHTGTTIVPTEAGDVTVLVEQRELSNLIKGTATSRRATAEASEAGRIARFVAQSAFYQMEQPYNDRNLLVCFDEGETPATVDAFMTAIEQSTWLQLTDLDTLAKATPHASGESAKEETPKEAKLSDSAITDLNNTLTALSDSHGDILRFRDAILDSDANASPRNASQARPDGGPSQWISTLLAAHNELALHALSTDGGSSEVADASRTVSAGARRLADDLLGGVHLTPSEAVTMVSETASMPVTISNTTAYPVTIRLSSITDSPEIVTSRTTTVTIAPKSESQVTFTLRAATSGSTIAHVTLLDRTDQAFGLSQDTPINCVLKISDKTGFVIIGLAVLLGVLGLWRQFNRKKDPDE